MTDRSDTKETSFVSRGNHDGSHSDAEVVEQECRGTSAEPSANRILAQLADEKRLKTEALEKWSKQRVELLETNMKLREAQTEVKRLRAILREPPGDKSDG